MVSSYKISDVREEENLQVIEIWADPEMVFRAVRLLAKYSGTYGLESSVIYDLEHAVLYFNPRAADIERDVTRLLDHVREQEFEEWMGAQDLLEDKAA